MWALALSDATRGLGCPPLAPSPTVPPSPQCVGSRVEFLNVYTENYPLTYVPSSPADGRCPWAGGLGPQGVGRRPVDRASWPALILCSPPAAPTACPPPCPPSGPRSPEQPRQGVPGWVPSLKPRATQPGQTCRWQRGLPIQGPQTGPAPLLLQRTPGTDTGLGSSPKGAARPRRATLPDAPQPLTVPPPARRHPQPLCCPQGPLIHWPRRLRACPRLPLPEVPSLPNPGRRAVGGARPGWVLGSPYVGRKK